MKKFIIFFGCTLLTLIILDFSKGGKLSTFVHKINQHAAEDTHIADSIETAKNERLAKDKMEEEKRKERELQRKIKAISEDLAYRVTLEMMNKVCPNSAKKSKHSIVNYSYNKITKTLTIEVASQWIGSSSMFSGDQLHQVQTKTTIFGNDNKTMIEIIKENEIFKTSKKNADIQSLASDALNLALNLLNEYQETIK
jgi:hypothetical protein